MTLSKTELLWMERWYISKKIANDPSDLDSNPKGALTQAERILMGGQGPAIISSPNLPMVMLIGCDRHTVNRYRAGATYPFIVNIDGLPVYIYVELKAISSQQLLCPDWRVTFRIIGATDWEKKNKIIVPSNIFGVIAAKIEERRKFLEQSFENMYCEARIAA